MKPRLFIGCSAEALSKANFIKEELKNVADCYIWSEGVFSQNRSAFEVLTKEAIMADFGVFLATKGDFAESRGNVFEIPRDNVIFEFALFLGSLGKNRTFLLAHKDLQLPSDLHGITVGKFNEEVTGHDSLRAVCEDLAKSITNHSLLGELGWFPSTALAIGYYQGFVKRVCEDLHAGAEINCKAKSNRYQDFKLHIVLPKSLGNGFENFRLMHAKRNGLETGVVENPNGYANKRGYPLYFKVDPDSDSIVKLYDAPSTLNTISETIRIFMGATHIGKDTNQMHLEERELNNFAKVLRHLIADDPCSKNNVLIEEVDI